MKIRLNEDREIVETVREGLIAKGGYCPCRVGKKPEKFHTLMIRSYIYMKKRDSLPTDSVICCSLEVNSVSFALFWQANAF